MLNKNCGKAYICGMQWQLTVNYWNDERFESCRW